MIRDQGNKTPHLKNQKIIQTSQLKRLQQLRMLARNMLGKIYLNYLQPNILVLHIINIF